VRQRFIHDFLKARREVQKNAFAIINVGWGMRAQFNSDILFFRQACINILWTNQIERRTFFITGEGKPTRRIGYEEEEDYALDKCENNGEQAR